MVNIVHVELVKWWIGKLVRNAIALSLRKQSIYAAVKQTARDSTVNL